ncbi:GNAT family N-acetyltransferase [Portibacter lacus]|uniref:N-acetyltransferase domain-containing protein n=1 Tax=Portibacter lacus TaxID=1099794 RepID=A0AA37SPW6_9BACT|nr:GNAT family N-acetyltransferase [Portibacter lacus]GLR16518.1 hypothetical protein GCM10007940_11330 [Portibacter lacus]
MISAIRKSDIPGLNSLPPEDWKFDYEDFLNCFIADDFFYGFIMTQDDKIIGTGNVLIKGEIAWLANIIVLEAYRGRGLGFQITQFLVDFSIEKGCKTQLLIATQLGEHVYRKIGFRKITAYQCFDSTESKAHQLPDAIRLLALSDYDMVCAMDFQANGEDRSHLIKKFYPSGFGYFNADHELLGCYLPDFGRGLVLSKVETAGIELLKLKHAEKDRRTMLPIENKVGIKFLAQAGLSKGSRASKMVLGEERSWHPDYIYSYGSGYCG